MKNTNLKSILLCLSLISPVSVFAWDGIGKADFDSSIGRHAVSYDLHERRNPDGSHHVWGRVEVPVKNNEFVTCELNGTTNSTTKNQNHSRHSFIVPCLFTSPLEISAIVVVDRYFQVALDGALSQNIEISFSNGKGEALGKTVIEQYNHAWRANN